MKSARRRSREFAMQGLYQWLISHGDANDINAYLCTTPGYDKADRVHLNTLLEGSIKQSDNLSKQLQSYLDRPYTELSPVEHAVLLVGAYELVYQPNIPYRVVINEAVELAKTFGGIDGFRYVNGVLDKFAANARPEEVGAKRNIDCRH
ncbi:transcription antitermination factor NusB [Candidatus Pandoraea novymonadis]|uniref:Transcription antitermination protein NusB n=1 Tax=Candidatus Pandoraea novymonadis TaxID=1808959 RepID=A0ABX5FF94_9BURK|nr:transcription antitermination factor NusB [Candidatus Pandoraea novymonadis]PSB92143.1 N utilization substance protein B [Candidatus Pandoraea novymonadis]